MKKLKVRSIEQFTDSEIRDAILKASTYLEVLQILGFKKRTKSRLEYLEQFIKNHQINIDHFNRINPLHIADKTDDEIKAAIKGATSLAGTLKLLGYAKKSTNNSSSRRYLLRKFIEENNLDISHFLQRSQKTADALKASMDIRHKKVRQEQKESRQRARKGIEFLSDAARWILNDCKKTDRAKRRSGNDLDIDSIIGKIRNGCSYCGEVGLKMVLDRVEGGDKAHSLVNTVGCCIRCNTIKGAMPHAAWVELVPTVKKIAQAGLFGKWEGVSYTGQELC